MSQTNIRKSSSEISYTIRQNITAEKKDLEFLNKYFKIYKSSQNQNAFYSEIGEIIPKLYKFFAKYDQRKDRFNVLKEEMKDLTEKNNNLRSELKSTLAQADTFENEKEILQAELEELQHEYIDSEEQKEFVKTQYENAKEQQEIFDRYARIYIKFAIPLRYAILQHLYETQSNLTYNLIIKNLLSNPEIKLKYPKIKRQNVYSTVKKLMELNFIDRVDNGLFHISKIGEEYFLESIKPTEKEQNESE